MGAGSEAWCIYQSLVEAKVLNANYYWVLVAILVTYPPGMLGSSVDFESTFTYEGVVGLYKQYTHMVSQRRKNIRGKKRQT